MNARTSRRRRPSRLRLTMVFLLTAAAGAAFVGWKLPRERDPELSAGWPAMVSVLAGSGQAGVRDADAWRAQFSEPYGIAVAGDGTVYVTDGADGNRIRAIASDGSVRTVAGGERGLRDDVGASARFDTPSGLAVDAQGMLYVADTGNHAIRRVTPDGRVVTITGGRGPGDEDGPAGSARFNGPIGLTVDGSGRVIVADSYNDRLRVIDAAGMVSTLAHPQVLAAAGVLPLDTPAAVAAAPSGMLYVADTGNHLVRTVSPDGTVGVLDTAPEALMHPVGVAVDAAGNLFVTEDRGRLLEVGAGGGARVVAGSRPGFRDGRGADAQFRRPAGVAVLGVGDLVVADAGNALVRRVTAVGRNSAAPPASPFVQPRFDVEAFAWQPLLWPLEPLVEPFEIAGTLGEARGADAGRFHAGIDVRADQGTPVVAVRDGVVTGVVATSDFGTLNEWLRIGPLAYVHMRVGRDARNRGFADRRFLASYDDRGRVVRVRVRRGSRFETGDVIGTVNAFSHVHVNVGWPGEEYNPLLFRLVRARDTIPPTIPRGGVHLYDADGQRVPRRRDGRHVVSGRVQVVVDAWDQMDGNLPHRRLGVYSLGYQVLLPDGTPAPGFEAPLETIRFDQLRSGEADPGLVFAPGSGIPFYGQRRTRFLYVVTNTLRAGGSAAGFWDTAALTPGDYTLRVRVADAAGNEALLNRDVPVTIVPFGAAEAPDR